MIDNISTSLQSEIKQLTFERHLIADKMKIKELEYLSCIYVKTASGIWIGKIHRINWQVYI